MTETDKALDAYLGAIRNELQRNAKTEGLTINLDWVDSLKLNQARGVWNAICLTRDAAVHDAVIH